MICPATKFINDIEEQVKTMTVHIHPDSTWIHSHGVDGHGNKRWSWAHINGKQKHGYYPCDEFGWIDAAIEPEHVGTKAICVDSEGEKFADYWYQCPEYKNCMWGFEEAEYTHWMPQSQGPKS